MPRPLITLKFVASKLDGKKITRAVRKAEDRNNRKTAAFIRKDARQSIRRRKKASSPGRPPSAHAPGSQGIKDIRYAKASGGYIIGYRKNRGGMVPHDLEGGARVRFSRRVQAKTGKKSGRLAARPAIEPARDRNLNRQRSLWKGSVKK